MQTENQQQTGAVQNQMNDFLNTILDRTSKISFDTLLKSTSTDVNSFEMYGNLSYLLGIGFSQNKWNQEQLFYITERLNKFGINYEMLTNYFSILANVNLNDFNAGKDHMLDFINQPIENDYKIKNEICRIIEKSLVPVNLSNTLYKRFFENPNEQMNYHDLIIFNNTFYEDLIVTADTSRYFIQLSKSESYKEKLKEASVRFDMQKFALIYIENIILMKEFLSKESNYTKATNFALVLKYQTEEEVVSFINNLVIEDVKAEVESMSEEEIEQVESINESEVGQNPSNDIKYFLEETNDILKAEGVNLDYKNNLRDFTSLLTSLLEGENQFVGDFYTYLKEIKKNNDLLNDPKYAEHKKQLEQYIIDTKVFVNAEPKELKDFLSNEVKTLQEEYTKFLNNYIAEIKPEHEDLLKMTNSLISMLHIQTLKDKQVLFSQIDTNSIFTYKHLHQVLLSIENQLISGYNIKSYHEIYEVKLKNENEEIYNMFTNNDKISSMEMQIKLLFAFKNIIRTEKDKK